MPARHTARLQANGRVFQRPAELSRAWWKSGFALQAFTIGADRREQLTDLVIVAPRLK